MAVPSVECGDGTVLERLVFVLVVLCDLFFKGRVVFTYCKTALIAAVQLVQIWLRQPDRAAKSWQSSIPLQRVQWPSGISVWLVIEGSGSKSQLDCRFFSGFILSFQTFKYCMAVMLFLMSLPPSMYM